MSGAAGPVLVTGGAGFLGANIVDELAREGRPVLLYDNLSRPGVETNLEWLRERHGDHLRVEIGDVRDAERLTPLVAQSSHVIHLAAQVAVTTSIEDPVTDFDVNLRGTLNVLEAVRAAPQPPSLVFASTNKVYGNLGDLSLLEAGRRHHPADAALRESGVAEHQALELCSPYGCSKGAADQYVLDYARIYGIDAVVFRMSCLYGPRQFGTEDQGWVAHFLISALARRPITIYGDGRQVRDVLFVKDAVAAFLLAERRMDAVRGRAFNLGGGPDNAVSLVELLDLIGGVAGPEPEVRFGAWRPGDQRWYVSDTTAFRAVTGWRPTVGVEAGLRQLAEWLTRSRTQETARRAAGVPA